MTITVASFWTELSLFILDRTSVGKNPGISSVKIAVIESSTSRVPGVYNCWPKIEEFNYKTEASLSDN